MTQRGGVPTELERLRQIWLDVQSGVNKTIPESEAWRPEGTPIQDCETYNDLVRWLGDNILGSSLHLLDGEVIIHTGWTVEMNGELMPLGGYYDE